MSIVAWKRSPQFIKPHRINDNLHLAGVQGKDGVREEECASTHVVRRRRGDLNEPPNRATFTLAGLGWLGSGLTPAVWSRCGNAV
jgi:hypothetical protein